MVSSRDQRLADRALAAQYALADIREGNPWVDLVGSVLYSGGKREGQRLTAQTKTIASRASTFVVSTDMTEVVKQAAEDLMFMWMQEGEVPDVILPYDLPHPSGFVLFSHSINLGHLLDDYDDEVRERGDVIPIVGFLWETRDITVNFAPISTQETWQEMTEKAFEISIDPQEDLERFEQKYGRPPSYYAHDLSGWMYGKPWIVDADAARIGGGGVRVERDGVLYHGFHPSFAIERAVLMTFLRLVEQRLPVIRPVNISRPLARQIKRKKPDLLTRATTEDGTLRLVALRKEYNPVDDVERPPDDPTTGVGWTHRWFCSPGWVKRRYATRDETGKIIGDVHGVEGVDWSYRKVYIAPHIKGPADKPLRLKDTVAVLKR